MPPDPYTPVIPGSAGEQVSSVHSALQQLGYKIEGKETEAATAGPTTVEAIVVFQRSHGLAETGIVDAETWLCLDSAVESRRDDGGTPHDPDEIKLSGTVWLADQAPLPGARILIAAQSLHSQKVLNETRTGKNGVYRALLSRADLRDARGREAAITVEAQDTQGQRLAQSLPQFRVRAKLTVDLRIPASVLIPPTEIERVRSAVQEALGAEKLTALSRSEIEFLARSTGLPIPQVDALNWAERAEASNAIPAAFIYACARAGLNPQLDRLSQAAADAMRSACAAAIANGIIPPLDGAAIESAIQALSQYRIASVANSPAAGQSAALNDLLTLALPDATLHSFIAETAIAHGADTQSFWQAIDADARITAPQHDSLHFVVSIAGVTGGFLPLVQAISGMRTAGTVQGAQDLARFDAAKWQQVLSTPINGKPIGVPDGVPGSTPAEKLQTYAAGLEEAFVTTYPTPAFAARVATGGLTGQAALQGDLVRFLSQSADLDLRTQPVAAYAAAHPAALDGIANPQTFLQQAARVQRIFRVAPRYEHINVLLPAGLNSALAIARSGRSAFTQRFEKDLGTDAHAIYSRAAQVSAITIHLVTQESLQNYNSGTPALQDGAVTLAARQAQAELFGSLDMCTCEDCRSVLSPAAYLTDLLAWLSNRPSTLPGASALNVLLDTGTLTAPAQTRRPDIAGIELSCINTNTPLPYIDLVNEILEQAITEPTPLPAGLAVPQTTRSADELAVTPEHVNEAAYTTLTTAVYPAPFDLHTTEARVFLNGMGSTRESLLIATFAADHAAALLDQTTIRERLELCDTAWNILTTVAPASPWTFWGISAATVLDPGGSGTIVDWFVALRYVPVFLQQAGIAYTDLLALLRSNFLAPGGVPLFTLTPASPTMLDTAKLHNLDAVGATRAMRFLRLWQTIGGSIDDLDALLSNIGITEITSASLTTLAMIQRVQALLPGPTLDTLAAFWGNVSTRIPPDASLSPFDLLFQNPAVSDPVSPAFALNVARTELAAPAGTISGADAPTLLGALKISNGDLTALLQPAGPVPDAMSLANLSALVRYTALAKALSMSVSDLLAIMPLIAVTPFDPAHIENAVAFLETMQAIRTSGFDAHAVRWLIEGATPTAVTAALPDAKIVQNLTALQTNLSIAPVGADPNPIVKTAIWPMVGFPDTYPVTLLSDQATPPGGGAPNMLAYFLLLNGGGITPAAAVPAVRRLQQIALLTSVLNVAGTDLPYFFNRTAGAPIIPGLGWLDPNALPASAIAADPARLKAMLRTAAGVTLASAEGCTLQHLFSIFTFATGNPKPATLVFISGVFPWPLPDLQTLAGTVGDGPLVLPFPASYQDERGLTRLKACFDLMKQCNVKADRLLSWAVSPVPQATSADIRVAARSGFKTEQAWVLAARPWQDTLRRQQRDALAGYLLGQLQSLDLAKQADSTTLISEYLIDVDMSSCMMTSRIKQAISSTQMFIQRVSMNLEPFVLFSDEDQRQLAWMKNYRVWEANREVFLYPEDWILPELRDDKSPFFKELENALLQAPVTNDMAESALMDYLTTLHSVARMEFCGYYHQIEREVHDIPFWVFNKETGQWENLHGRRRRVWGATTIDCIHVIGRTFATPRTLYYRRYIDGSYWTAWEKVTLTINSNHIVPIVFNRRLRVCWVTIKKVNDPNASSNNAPANSTMGQAQPAQLSQLTMNWSEYQNGKWSSAATGTDPSQQLTATQAQLQEESQLFFQGFIDNEDLVVRCFIYGEVEQIDGGGLSSQFQVLGDFRFAACMGTLTATASGSQAETPFTPPAGAIDQNQTFALQSSLQIADPSWETLVGALPDSNSVLAYGHQYLTDPLPAPFFLSDDQRSFFAMPVFQSRFGIGQRPRWPLLPSGPAQLPPAMADDPNPIGDGTYSPAIIVALQSDAQQVNSVAITDPPYRTYTQFQFYMAFHPWVCTFVEELERGGVDALYRRWVQVAPYILNPVDDHLKFFRNDYNPDAANVVQPYPVADVDFSFGGAYSGYDWELFYHAPMLIAARLTTNQKFEDALRWLQRIFDPTDRSALPAPHRFWRTRPFFDAGAAQSIQGLMALLDTAAAGDPARRNLVNQLTQWRKKPFNPHLIARLRTGAYQKATVMAYLDALIGWGDQLFGRNTIESINEATQAYLAAAAILGPRPPLIPAATPPPAMSFTQIQSKLDDFSNALLGLETLLPSTDTPSQSVGVDPVPAVTPILYFCFPPNAKLLKYWDTVAGRLSKVRNCQNLAGVVEQLPLFEPPIDPGLLVAATAAGLSLDDVLNNLLTPPVINFRFEVMVKHAHEMVGRVVALGAKLLTALERRDAAALQLLKSGNELSLMALIREVKAQNVDASQQAIDALQASQQIQLNKIGFYQVDMPLTLLFDVAAVTLRTTAIIMKLAAMGLHTVSSVAHAFPQAMFGSVAIAPQASVTIGGEEAGKVAKEAAETAAKFADATKDTADAIRIAGDDVRKLMEWEQKAGEAKDTADKIGKDIIVAQTRLAMAQKELDNYDVQISNAQAVDDFYHNEFTNEDLYGWLISQTAALYFQSYQLAYDVAQQAEQAFQLELGIYPPLTPFIGFGYWDSLQKGLLAGERLQLDIARMEAAYYKQRVRVHEITKKISLKTHAPDALAALQLNGSCFVSFGEDVFDADYPTHYMRRIALVNVALAFDNTDDAINTSSIACTLTLAQDEIRTQPGRVGDPDIVHTTAQSMVASTGQALTVPTVNVNYGGMFVIDFLKDERFFPFEGAGVISEFHIAMPQAKSLLSSGKVTDIALQFKYTALGEPVIAADPLIAATP